MDPRFECPFCGRVVRYLSEAGKRSVAFNGTIRFRDRMLSRNATFCGLCCLFAYLKEWRVASE